MPTEVLVTSRADQQIAALTRRQARAFDGFLDDLAARGCQALAYRLSGESTLTRAHGQLRNVMRWLPVPCGCLRSARPGCTVEHARAEPANGAGRQPGHQLTIRAPEGAAGPRLS